MNELFNFWKLIVESNTFNFIVLLVILVIVMQKLKVSEAAAKLKDNIVNAIENAKNAKEKAKTYYDDAKSKIEHIEDEVFERLALATRQAENVADSISENTSRKVTQIEHNVEKVVEAEKKTLITELTDKTTKSSIILAEKYIKLRLDNEPELQDKYIEEGIEELDKVNI